MDQQDAAVIKKKPEPSMADGQHMDILIIHALMDSLFKIFTTMMNTRVLPGVPVPTKGVRLELNSRETTGDRPRYFA